MNSEIIQQRLTEKFGDAVHSFEQMDLFTFCTTAENSLKVLQHLHDDETLGFRFLTDLTAVHYPDRKEEELCVVYHLHNLKANVRLRMKVYVPGARPDVPTSTSLFSGANWMERETYDFFGVNFVGHPDLRRILNTDEMDYFPMLKQYPMEDPTRTDKDDDMFGRGGNVTDFTHQPA